MAIYEQALQTFSAILPQIIADKDKFNLFLNGGVDEFVETTAGPVPTLAGIYAENGAELATKVADAITDIKDGVGSDVQSALNAAQSASQSEQNAIAAMEATGDIKGNKTKPEADSNLASYAEGQLADVYNDADYGGAHVRYRVTSGEFEFLRIIGPLHARSTSTLLSMPQIDGLQVDVASFYFLAPQAQFYGGGRFVWSGSRDKATANGGTVIDPDALAGFDGTPETRDAYLNAQGAGAGAGTGCWVRLDAYPLLPEWYGAVGDNATDDYVPLTRALNTVSGPSDCVRICLRPTQYYSSQALDFNLVTELEGVGANSGTQDAAAIRVPADSVGVYINSSTTLGGALVADKGVTASGSVIRGVYFIGGGQSGSNPNAHGIVAYTRHRLHGVKVALFQGDGVYINSAELGGQNINDWRHEEVRVAACGRHGFFYEGADANAGVGVGLSVSNVNGWGIFDSSFLGNTFVGGDLNNCDEGAYYTDNDNARTLFLGVYVEPNCPKTDIAYNTIVIGGHHTVGRAGTGAYWVDGIEGLERLQTGDISLSRGTSVLYGKVQNKGSASSGRGAGWEFVAGEGEGESPLSAIVGYPDFGNELALLTADSGGVYQRRLNIRATHVAPQEDGAVALGRAGNRWSEVFSANGAINTSDEREKTDIRSLTDKEIAVGAAISPMVYRWKQAATAKGESARLHCTPIAQDVIKAFEGQGLDAFAYGVCCHDEWREYNGQPVEVDENDQYREVVMQIGGETVEPNSNGEYPEGAEEVELVHDTVYRDRYSLRETEALWFVQAATQARLDKLES